MESDKKSVCHPERRKAQAPPAVELLRVERSERAEAQGVAAAGSRNKLRWLANGMLHPVKKQPKLVRRSLRRIRSSVLAWIVACGSLPHQNFDFAQDDRLIVYLR